MPDAKTTDETSSVDEVPPPTLSRKAISDIMRIYRMIERKERSFTIRRADALVRADVVGCACNQQSPF